MMDDAALRNVIASTDSNETTITFVLIQIFCYAFIPVQGFSVDLQQND